MSQPKFRADRTGATEESVHPDPREPRALLAFVRMWAVAHIAHLSIANDQSLSTVPSLVTFAAAFVLLVRPHRADWFAVMVAAQLVDMVWEMPQSPDHWMLVGFVNVAFLLGLVRNRGSGIVAVATAFPTARWLLLIGYSAAALAKYNSTFLDTAQSCATAMAAASTFGLSRSIDGPHWFLMTVATETAIPVLLLVPRTRRHAVRVGLVFHLMLTISPAVAVEDFSSTLYALFFLFLAQDDAVRMLDGLRSVGDRSAIVRDARRVPWVFVAVGFTTLGLLGHLSVRVSLGVAIVASGLYLVVLMGAGVASWVTPAPAGSIGRPSLRSLPLLLALVVWAASPYLGLRTTGVFTMFSSVRTEGDVGNHLFLPSYRVVDWQEDLVVIQESNDPAMDGAEGGRLALPLLGLRRLAMDDPDLVVTGDLHGKRLTWGPGEGQRELEPLPWWQYRLVLFRPVPVDGSPYCTVS